MVREAMLQSAGVTIPEAFQLAMEHHQAGRLAEAEGIYRQILAVEPNHADALHLLGVIAGQAGRHDVAADLIGKAIALAPADAAFHSNFGLALSELGRSEEAIGAYRRAIQLNPNFSEAYNNLGVALVEQGRLDEAIVAYDRALQLKPHNAEVHVNLGNALKEQGRLDEAIASYRLALQLKSNQKMAHSNLLLCLHNITGSDLNTLFVEHRKWDEVHAEPLRKLILPHCNDRDPERRLRVGYVSPDFRGHPVAYFAEGVLGSHDRSQVEVYCYADLLREDDISQRLRGCADHWRKITGKADWRVADLIRKDGIDILVDLAGHTACNRLLVFARKPAPVQVTYLGYPNTTGMKAMDYRLTDGYADPPGTTEHLHSEELMRLPGSAWCYRPPEGAPLAGPAPVLNRGYVTFGCFNARPKMTEEMLALWARLLMAVPGSRLLLKNPGFREASVRERAMGMLVKCGMTAERVEFMGKVPSVAGHLATYERVDIALDTYPYHGTTTTCEALWMGVPVITIAGRTHASRVGVSLLTNAGLPELIAGNAEQYVEIAAKLAADIPRLAELRANLRERMAASPLMDTPRFARNVEEAYRQMWRAWCAGKCLNPTS